MTMRRTLVCLALAVLLGCMNGTGPAPDVSGRWFANRPEFSLTLDLLQLGTSVHGTGNSWGFILPPTHSYTIAGTYSRPSLTLTLIREDSLLSSITGTVRDANHMQVVQTIGAFSDTLTFARQ
jgi:hypothetical protein